MNWEHILLPELRLARTGAEEEEALRRSKFGVRSWQRIIWLGTVVPALIAGIAILAVTIERALPLHWGIKLLLQTTSITCFSATVSLLFNWTWRNPMRKEVRIYLQGIGVPICIKCGYDLRGQTIARCPECATPFCDSLICAQAAEDADESACDREG